MSLFLLVLYQLFAKWYTVIRCKTRFIYTERLLDLLYALIAYSNLSCLLDLSCVNNMPYLVILDASHNEISNFFGFQPPKNLKVTEDLELTG